MAAGEGTVRTAIQLPSRKAVRESSDCRIRYAGPQQERSALLAPRKVTGNLVHDRD